MNKSRERMILPLGMGILILVVRLLSLGDLRDSIFKFYILFGAMCVLYCIAVVIIMRSAVASRRLLIIIVGYAVILRAVLIVAPPALSTDINRYLWEGRAILAGHNPFVVPPDDPSLEALRDDTYSEINHNHLETIYPPVAQAVFVTGAAVAPNLTMQKVLFTLFDIGVILLLVVMLAHRKINRAMCLVYAWNPLVILEFSHSGHLDAVGIFFLMLGIYFFDRIKKLPGFVALTFSFLVKYIAAAFVPFFIVKKKYIAWLPLCLLVAVLAYLPFAGAGWKLFSSLKLYASTWEFNSAIFSVGHGIGLGQEWMRRMVFVMLAAFAFFQGVRQQDLLRYGFLVIGAILLLSPTVHPWYVTWIVPFLAFYPSRGWILFTCLVVLAYTVLPVYEEMNLWVLADKVLLIEYVPFYFLLIYDALRNGERKRV